VDCNHISMDNSDDYSVCKRLSQCLRCLSQWIQNILFPSLPPFLPSFLPSSLPSFLPSSLTTKKKWNITDKYNQQIKHKKEKKKKKAGKGKREDYTVKLLLLLSAAHITEHSRLISQRWQKRAIWWIFELFLVGFSDVGHPLSTELDFVCKLHFR